MTDDAYAERLKAILTNPSPKGINPDDAYGQADDGIDRYDGFGQDVWVESLEVTDGEHGAELVVEFGLALPPGPDWRGAPQRGSLRLPFDAEWRELSGYLDPADYAPEVARQVQIAAGKHIEHHRAPTGGDQVPPTFWSDEEAWELLMQALADEGTVREVAPGRIELRIPNDRPVTIVVTPDQWKQVLVAHGAVDFGELLGARDDDEDFVVFYKGGLTRSIRENLPPVRGRAWERALAEARATQPEARLEWHMHPPRER